MKQKNKREQGMRTFYTLILTQVFSLIGSRISGLAIGIWVYGETGNATPLALVGFFAVVPQVVASSISGVLADRYDRRYMMALADAGQAVGTLLLLASFASGDFQLWHLYTVTLIQAIFGVFQGPAFSASVTMLVPDEKRDRANAIRQITDPAAGIIAPAIAGFIYVLIGVEGAILIDMATFLVAVAVVLNVHIPRPEQTEAGKAMSGSIWKEALGGLRYLLARRTLLGVVLHVSLLNFLVGGAGALMIPYILARTGSEATLGILMSTLNIGAIVGAVIIGAWGGTRPRIHTIMLGVIAIGVFLVLLGTAQTGFALGAALFLTLLPIPMINASFSSMLQAKVAPDVQGRVFAVLGQIGSFLTPLAYLLAGPLADQVFEPAVGQAGWETVAPLVGNGVGSGMGMIIAIGGALAALTTVVVYALPSVRHMEANLPDYEPVAAVETEDSPVSDEPEMEVSPA